MNDILEDLNRWLDLPIIERRFQQQIGDEPAAGLDLVARAIDYGRMIGVMGRGLAAMPITAASQQHKLCSPTKSAQSRVRRGGEGHFLFLAVTRSESGVEQVEHAAP
jgi:hypothetical protein